MGWGPRRTGWAKNGNGIYVSDWTEQYTLADGTRPTLVLDFANGRYFDGTNYFTDPSVIVNNTPTITPGSGLLCNANNITLKGAALSAFQASTATMYMETTGGTNGTALGLIDFGSSSCGFLENADHTVFGWNGANIVQGPNSNLFDWTTLVRYAASWGASGTSLASLGNVNTNAGVISVGSTVTLGSWTASFLFGGYIKLIVLYGPRLADKYLKSLTWPATWRYPLAGGGGVQTPVCATDTTLNSYFTNSSPWTALCSGFYVSGAVTGNAGQLMFTGVANGLPGTGPWVGHEIWYPGTTDTTGFGGAAGIGAMRMHIMSGWGGAGDTTHSLQVNGSTALFTGVWHVCGGSYDGSGSTSGIKLYVDGVEETYTVDHTTLSGASSQNSSNALQVGSQYGGYTQTYMDFFAMYRTVKPASWWADIVSRPTRPPPNDSDCMVYYDFSEATGTTATDKSVNGHNGTLSGSSTWF